MPKREDHELPYATTRLKWSYHHTGIPTNVTRENETYIASLKMYVSGFESSPYGIEWMRFEDDSPVHPLIQRFPHVAFVVDNLQEALAGKDMITEVTSPSENIKVAMIQHNGVPIELMEIGDNDPDIK
ncbi:MAG: hypothetical protein GF313_08685 [Caldithrix sp.]|nr:hypothetical protein [Caldithrix sp.]